MGNKTQFRHFRPDIHENIEIERSRWILITKEMIPKSQGKKENERLELLKEWNQDRKIKYEMPKLLDVALCAFLEYITNGKILYPQEPWTCMYCQEKNKDGLEMVIGGYSKKKEKEGLIVSPFDPYDFNFAGISACLVFE